MSAKARAASARRSARVKPPASSAASTTGYASGEVTTATLAWFLAAARTMAGPPMSIFSMHSSMDAPEATVSENGYRLEMSRSNGSTSSSASCARCVSRRTSASRPACTRGCSVFTRPSRHSGKPVSSSTRVTGAPVVSSCCAVEPVETISTPCRRSAAASPSSPVLSHTLISARRMGFRSLIPPSLFCR